MATLTKRNPNSEQQKAIYHQGGKLLSAGAGSGKTFVLIEHLIYLLEGIQKKTAQCDWKKTISVELSQIVLMTFTKKAAGEMSVRMLRKVEGILEEACVDQKKDDLIFWTLVCKNLSSLNIMTIHGFCHRLLRMGFWSEFPQEINLVSSVEHKNKIQKLFDKWFEHNRLQLDPLFLAGSQSLLSAMVEIFSSPELRVLWKSPKNIATADSAIDSFFNQLIEIKGYRSIWSNDIDLSVSEKEKNKKWYEFLIQFDEMKNKYGIIGTGNYKHYVDFFKTVSRFPTTSSKEISTGQKEFLNHAREFREDLKKINEDLSSLENNFEIYQKWVLTLSDLFNYIDCHYFEIDGFSFSDLEYYVLMGLRRPDVLIKVQESYSYFIVDEFQDTSHIQFEIIKHLIGGKLEKIFCVGDRKQAIYGFRGGELQVFSECEQLLGGSNNYFLKNNFRSLDEIVEFNNHLFEQVFPLGLGFAGKDPHGVAMEAQIAPVETKNVDSTREAVIALKVEVLGENSDFDLDYLESIKLSEYVEQLLVSNEYKTICILYRKLRPSGMLLEHLLAKNISFSAQVKIKFGDDPLINMFLYLIELCLNKNELKKKEATITLLETLLSVVGVSVFHLDMLKVFFFDQGLLGLRLAFHKFVFSVGLSNSYHAQNAELIDAICRLTKEDLVKCYDLLKSDEGESYACEMMSGASGADHRKRITIMSAHASKGLEFDAVLLGGIHTNGRYNGMKNYIGKFPHSFKWKKSFDQKKFFKSPFYYLESELLMLKDFSESKRLLYVACTRAVKHLAYVDLWSVVKNEAKSLYLYDNSWIHALRLGRPCYREDKVVNQIDQNNVEISLIQRDSVGMFVQNKKNSLGIISELSVTRLATIADCPFKFYLQNICKIESSNNKPSFDAGSEEVETFEGDVFYSSMKRGTRVHNYLSKIFLNEMELNDVPVVEQEVVSWVCNLISKDENNFEIVSEKMIKFSFFGQMVSGTPDLVLIAPNGRIIVWDFKTGIRNSECEEGYWFQLMSYAYAYAGIKKNQLDQEIEISLLYLDQKEIVTRVLSFYEITQVLFSFWQKTESLSEFSSKHCSQCNYSNICSKGHNCSESL